MLERRCAIPLLLAACCVGVARQALPAEPSARDLLPAHPAVLFDPARRCPDLRQAQLDDEGIAVVAFQVSPTGVPSQPSLISSSGSNDLDTAAVSCVMKLKFQPAVSRGDGIAVVSRQAAAWKWARPGDHHADPARGAAPPAAAPTAAPTAAVVAAAAAAPAAAAPAAAAPAAAAVARQIGGSVVRVCVDGSGRLAAEPSIVQSSGDAAFDHAALGVAKAGSGSYRALPGCLELSLRPD
jgi:TonB family protein